MNKALNELVDRAAQSASAGSYERVAAELGALTRLMFSAPRVAKALAAVDASGESKAALLNDLTKHGFSATSIDLAVDSIQKQRPTSTALGQLLADVMCEFVLRAALRNGNLEAVEGQLSVLAQLFDNDELRDAFTNPGLPDSSKDKLVSDLLSGKASPVVVELVRVAVAAAHGRDLGATVKAMSYRAAELRDVTVAEVHTAIQLDAERQRRLTEALSKSLGKKVESRFTIDPSIVGSVVVRIGDEIIDDSVRQRIEQARRAVSA
jgi:F-type H+-transporting ATPase subunit delta